MMKKKTIKRISSCNFITIEWPFHFVYEQKIPANALNRVKKVQWCAFY